MTGRLRRIALFVEGSQATNPLRQDFSQMWRHLAAHCGGAVDFEFHPVSKKQILLLKPSDVAVPNTATQLVKAGKVQVIGGGDALDVVIDRAYKKRAFDRAIVVIDRLPPNQDLTDEEANVGCPMRPEIAWVLKRLSESKVLDARFRSAAQALLARYQSKADLQPRTPPLGLIEFVFMDPEFEALFIEDEPTVRKALKVPKKKPHDWKPFPKRKREFGKHVLDHAIRTATGLRNAYSSAPARWGRAFVEAADNDAKLWRHPIVARLGRTIAP